jgi:hypothetical protein
LSSFGVRVLVGTSTEVTVCAAPLIGLLWAGLFIFGEGVIDVAGITGIGASFSSTAAFFVAAVGTFVGLWGACFPGLLRLFVIFEFMAEEKQNVVGKW